MPGSLPDFKVEIRNYLFSTYEKDNIVLDVGPGCGGFFALLANHFHPLIDCVEIFEPYIHRFELKKYYRNVFIGDACDFDYDDYDIVILGDILEHLEIEDAKKLLRKIHGECKEMIVCVPFLSEQAPERGNIHETHIQSDLTDEIMMERYGEWLIPLGSHYKNDRVGVYRRSL